MGPAELSLIGLNREAFKRSDHKSWRGPCPECGGDRRFCVWTWRPWPHWYWACDVCGTHGWADERNTSLREPFSPERKNEYDRIRADEYKRRERDLQSRRQSFAKTGVLELHHSRLRQDHRALLRQWGIDDEWQDYLLIGYLPHKRYWSDKPMHSPAFSFPYFGERRQFVTMQYRLLGEGIKDRYRFEYGLGTSYYNPTPDEQIGDDVLIVEGVKKAIVTRILGRLNVTVLGVPSRSDFGGVDKAVQACQRKWVLLDPDATERAKFLAQQIDGKVLCLSIKVDDYLIENKTGWKTLRELVV